MTSLVIRLAVLDEGAGIEPSRKALWNQRPLFTLCRKVSFGIVLPEVVPLGVGVVHVRLTHAKHLLQDAPITQHDAAQLSPILPLVAADHVIDGGERKVLRIATTLPAGSCGNARDRLGPVGSWRIRV